jgi:hypothetical protein
VLTTLKWAVFENYNEFLKKASVNTEPFEEIIVKYLKIGQI